MEGVNIIYNYIDYFKLYHRASFSRATNFADFMDFGTSTKFVSLKIIENNIMTWIAD